MKRTTETPGPVVALASVSSVGNVEQDHEEATPLSEDAMKIYEYLIGVYVAYFGAFNGPNKTTSGRLQLQEQNTHCAHDVQVSHYGDNLAEEADTTVIQQQRVPSEGSSQVQHYGASGLRLIKGQVAASWCA